MPQPARPQAPPLRLRLVLLHIALGLSAAACTSQERLTTQVTPCGSREVKIINSDFSRRGVTTAWCAECKGKLYLCATNAERTKVECRPSAAADVCR